MTENMRVFPKDVDYKIREEMKEDIKNLAIELFKSEIKPGDDFPTMDIAMYCIGAAMSFFLAFDAEIEAYEKEE